MSTATGNVVIAIKAVDEASGVLGQLSSALTGTLNQLGPLGQQMSSVISGFATGGAMGAAVAGIGALVVSLKGCVEQAVEAEDVWNKLKVTVENSGTAWENVSASVHTFAESMASMSRFSDETVAKGLKTLIDYGMDLQTAMDNIGKTMDLATAKQVSLNEAATAVGKAFSGQEGILTRMGVVIDTSVPKAERFSAAMAVLGEKFGGAAQKDLDSFAGKWANFQNKMSELAEKIGNLLLPGLTKMADLLIGLIDTVTNFSEAIAGAIKWLHDLWDAMTAGCASAVDTMTKTLSGCGEYITDTFAGIYKALVGGSIWTDMWDEMVEKSARSMDAIRNEIGGGLGTIQGDFGIFSTQVSGSNVTTGSGQSPSTITVHMPITIQNMTGSQADAERLAEIVALKLGQIILGRR